MNLSAGPAAPSPAGVALRLVWIGVLTATLSGPAPGHIVYGGPTLSRLVAEAAVVARARIENPDGLLVLDDPALRRPVVEARIVELVKGEAEPGVVRFAQHGHGVAPYEEGEEVLLFLAPIAGSRELAALGGKLDWVSLQEHDAKYPLTAGAGAAYLEAAHAYAALGAIDDPGERADAWRRLTLELAASPEERLATSAVTDLALVGDGVALSEEDLAHLIRLLDDGAAPIGVRIALLSELERRRALDAPARWAQLLRASRGPDLAAVMRAARAHPSPAVTAELLRLLRSDDPGIRSAAAIALGAPGNDDAVEPLAAALADGDERLRAAAVRGLGGIGTARARAALAAAADSHPDPSTRRRARAELEALDRPTPGDR